MAGRLTAPLATAVLAFLTLTAVAPRQAPAGDGMTLEDANRRWRGASCRSLLPITFKGGPDRHGVAKSRWLFYDEEGGNHRARFVFENANALPRSLQQGIPAGTEFTAVGWGEDKPGGSIFFEVELATAPVRAKLYYWDDWVGKVEANRVDDFERWVRFDVFRILEAPDEQLKEVESRTSASARTAASQPAATAPAQVFAPEITLHAVAVQPAEVVSGARVLLVLTYQVSGLPPGAQFEAAEIRRLHSGERELATFSQQIPRGTGSYTSKLPVQIPADAGAGLYTLEARVELAGASSTGTAFFQVTAGEN